MSQQSQFIPSHLMMAYVNSKAGRPGYNTVVSKMTLTSADQSADAYGASVNH